MRLTETLPPLCGSAAQLPRCTVRESTRSPLFRSKKFNMLRGFTCRFSGHERRKHLFFHFRPVPSADSISFAWLKPREPIRKVRQAEFMVAPRRSPVSLREIPLAKEYFRSYIASMKLKLRHVILSRF